MIPPYDPARPEKSREQPPHYGIHFWTGTDPADVGRVLADQFDLTADQLFAGAPEDFDNALLDHPGMAYPIVTVLNHGRGAFGCELESQGPDLDVVVGGIGERALAERLCAALGVRALIDWDDWNATAWYLVRPDGTGDHVSVLERPTEYGALLLPEHASPGTQEVEDWMTD